VWLPAESAGRITYFGDHAHEGDVVTVRGVFNAACPEHGGDTDIHADDLTVVTVGRMVEDPVHPGKLAWAVGLALLAGVVFAAYRWVLR
ncbi:MAG: hypothetical protein JXP37_02115, partial [Coriobacteriia bacterium]|nr:hypothetical protein [Coriobacteriia bacterium]